MKTLNSLKILLTLAQISIQMETVAKKSRESWDSEGVGKKVDLTDSELQGLPMKVRTPKIKVTTTHRSSWLKNYQTLALYSKQKF